MEEIIGELNTTPKSKLIFSNKIIGAKRYGAIRKYVTSQKYTGYTKQGLTLDEDQLNSLYEAIVAEAYYINAAHQFPREEVIYQHLDGEHGIQAKVQAFSGQQYVVIQRVYIQDEEVKPGHGFAVPSIKIEKLIYFVGEMLDRLDRIIIEQPIAAIPQRLELDIPKTKTTINDRVLRDLWGLHKDTQKIAKLLVMDRVIIRDRLIEMDLI